MTQPQLMRQIADAMERNPEGWFREFEICFDGEWMDAEPREVTGLAANCPHKVRPKPHTYTLHVQEMPEHEYCHVFPASDPDNYSIYVHARYPDEPTAREALEKLTKAMGGE